jgi:hypothetical protein
MEQGKDFIRRKIPSNRGHTSETDFDALDGLPERYRRKCPQPADDLSGEYLTNMLQTD